MINCHTDEFKMIQLFKNGNKSVFSELIKPYYMQAYKMAYSILRQHHDAEDATQNAILKIYKSLESFKGTSSFKNWFIKIVKNHAIDLYRSNRRTVNIKDSFKETVKLSSTPPARANVISVGELKNNFTILMKEISPRYKEVMKLRYVDSLSYEEISDTLNCSVGTVKSRLSRGRKQINTLMNCTA